MFSWSGADGELEGGCKIENAGGREKGRESSYAPTAQILLGGRPTEEIVIVFVWRAGEAEVLQGVQVISVGLAKCMH